MTAIVSIGGYGRSVWTVCIPCGYSQPWGADDRDAALDAARHNTAVHTDRSLMPDATDLHAARTTMEARFFTAATGAPPTDEQRAAVVQIREAIIDAATLIEVHVPKGRNKAIALTELENAAMRANRGIFAPEEHR